VKISHLLTASPKRPEEEDRLLSPLSICLPGCESLPTEQLTGALAEQAVPGPLTVALPPPEDRAFADVWTALGGELKPSLDVVVTAPVDAGRRYPAGPPVRDGMRVDFGDLLGEQADGLVVKHRPE